MTRPPPTVEVLATIGDLPPLEALALLDRLDVALPEGADPAPGVALLDAAEEILAALAAERRVQPARLRAHLHAGPEALVAWLESSRRAHDAHVAAALAEAELAALERLARCLDHLDDLAGDG